MRVSDGPIRRDRNTEINEQRNNMALLRKVFETIVPYRLNNLVTKPFI